MQSIAAIPQIIENAVYIDTRPNEDVAKNPDIREYEYYVAGLNIGGTDYTIRAAVGVATTGNKYYDHKLTRMEKGDLLEMTSRVSTTEISNQSPLSDIKDKRLLQILQDSDTPYETRYSLNESSDSAFAKAVDDVVSGKVTRNYVHMGTTPDVLKMLGVPNTEIRIKGSTIQKVMGIYLGIERGGYSHIHNMTPETLKLLPRNLNNPVAVFKSSTHDKGYVVLTELTEQSKGKDKSVIAALHLKTGKGGAEVASVYGRSDSQIQTAFNDTAIYIDTKKARNLKTERLQLPWDFTSDAELSERNIKTESDLRQYQSANNSAKNRQSPESVANLADDIRAHLGKVMPEFADGVKVVQVLETMPKDAVRLITGGVEGWFDPRDNSISLVAENLNVERAVWVAWQLRFLMCRRWNRCGVRRSLTYAVPNLYVLVSEWERLPDRLYALMMLMSMRLPTLFASAVWLMRT